MNSLKEAEAQLSLKRAEYEKQRNLVESAREAEFLPRNIEKYQGKYFKGINTYSSGPEWFIYYFVEKLESYNYCKTISFQSLPDGKFELEINTHLHISLLEHEISKEEFVVVAKEFEKNISENVKKMLTDK